MPMPDLANADATNAARYRTGPNSTQTASSIESALDTGTAGSPHSPPTSLPGVHADGPVRVRAAGPTHHHQCHRQDQALRQG
eukprot:g28756.t1